MDVVENLELKEEFLNDLSKYYTRTRKGIHISDLLYCLPEVYFNRKHGVKHTNKTLSNFLDGELSHEALQLLSPRGKVEYKVSKFGLKGSIDIYRDKPIEFKRTRNIYKDINPVYASQLIFYCVLTGKNTGSLIVQHINVKEEEDIIQCVDLKFTQEELDQATAQLIYRKRLLEYAYEHNDPSQLPRSFAAWKCKDCNHRERCSKKW